MTKRRIIGGLLGLSGLSLLATGFLHTAAGASLLRRVMGSDECPFGGSTASLSTAEQAAARQVALLGLRGEAASKSQPAFGFELRQTRQEDVLAWAKEVDADCDRQPKFQRLECRVTSMTLLPAGEVDAPGTIFFRFDADNRLQSASAMAYMPSAGDVSRALEMLVAQTQKSVGPIAHERGQRTETYLAAAALNQAAMEFRFQDYHAELMATNMGPQADFILLHSVQTLVD